MSLDLTTLDEGWEARMARVRDGATGGERQGGRVLEAHGIPNGYYTLTLPDGSHKTWRIHTKKLTSKFAPGERVLSFLIGPNNTSDYEGVGFVREGKFVIWKRYRGTKVEMHAGLMLELMGGRDVEGCELEMSKRCLVCNRELTDPESLARGIGPLCWERMNG